jgi:glycine/D-amino acid oxidase-like deaminating enzyme
MRQRVETRLRSGRPIWLSQGSQQKQSFPSLQKHQKVEVAIVGGGFTGALTAIAFAEAGVSTILLEAGRVGCGSTAASSALLLHEPDKGLAELIDRYGAAASERIWQLSRDAVSDLTLTLRRLRTRCDLVQRDAVYYATNAEAAAQLRDEHRLRTKSGFGAEWLTPSQLRDLTGIAGHGALRTTRNAQFDPYKACLGLLRAGTASGAQIFERSRVSRIERLRHGVRLHTSRARVDASAVVIATGYATPYFRPLAGRFRMYRTHVLATASLTEKQRRELGLGQVMVWDTERPYHYARWTADHRLLLGGGDRPVRAGRRRDVEFTAATSELRKDFETLLPALANLRTATAWEGRFAMTPDSLPYIGPHRRYPKHLFALGYGGNGMTFSALAARMLLEQWQGKRSADHHLFAFGRFRALR